MTFGFDDLSDFHKAIAARAEEEDPAFMKRFLRQEAKKLVPYVENAIDLTTNKKTGRLSRAAKAGKVYKYKQGGNSLAVRVYLQNNKTEKENSAPHSHLVDAGHKIVPRGNKGKSNKGGAEIGFVQGRHFIKKALEKFKEEYLNDCQEMLNEYVYKELINSNPDYKARYDFES